MSKLNKKINNVSTVLSMEIDEWVKSKGLKPGKHPVPLFSLVTSFNKRSSYFCTSHFLGRNLRMLGFFKKMQRDHKDPEKRPTTHYYLNHWEAETVASKPKASRRS